MESNFSQQPQIPQELDPQQQSDQLAQQQPQEETISISGMVNQELVEQIQQMGFTKEVAEKALFLTQDQKTIEAALDWIEQNQNAPDFHEELRIVQQQQKSLKSKEEAQREARELQAKIRAQRQQKDKELEIEQEKERLRSTKELQKAKAALEEAERKRAIEAQLREKKEFELEKKRMLEQLQRDKEERFGKKFQGTGGELAQQKSPEELMQHGIKTINTLYPEYNHPGVAKTCMQTLQIYVKNVIEHPQELEKYGKIKSSNQAFQNRVAKITGGLMFLKAAGFQDEGEFYILKSAQNMVKANSILQEALNKLG